MPRRRLLPAMELLQRETPLTSNSLRQTNPFKWEKLRPQALTKRLVFLRKPLKIAHLLKPIF
jgi:hypothetical protein